MKLLLAIFLLTLSCAYCQQSGPRGPWGEDWEKYADQYGPRGQWGEGKDQNWPTGPWGEGKDKDQNWPAGPWGIGKDKYTDRYDGMNIDQMLGNKRLVNAYVKCLDGSGKCTSDGRYLKLHVTDALKTGCKRCTDAQHKGVRKVVKYMIDEEPKVWEQLVKMYDPKGEYSRKYYDELKTLQQGKKE